MADLTYPRDTETWTSPKFIIYKMVEFHYIHDAYGDLLIELFACPSVIKCCLSCYWQSGFFHGAMTPPEKREVQEGFISGTLPVIVATNAETGSKRTSPCDK